MNAKASLDWLGTTRGKVGFVVTPDNRLQIYGTGGVAYGGGSSHFNIFDCSYNSYWSGNPSSTRVGWTIGAGVEYAMTNNVTIGAEYLYADLGSTQILANPNSLAASALPEHLCKGQVRLQRVDLPRSRELQVLSASRFDLN